MPLLRPFFPGTKIGHKTRTRCTEFRRIPTANIYGPLKTYNFHYTQLIFPYILMIRRLKIFQGPATSSAAALTISVAC